MNKTLSILVGSLYGLILSLLVTVTFSNLSAFTAGGSADHVELWMWWDFVPSFILGYAILALYFINTKRSFKESKLWLISTLSAFLLSLVIGTVGSIFGDYMQQLHYTGEHGMGTISVRGDLGWGTVYALVFLPLSIPLMRLSIIPLIRFNKQK